MKLNMFNLERIKQLYSQKKGQRELLDNPVLWSKKQLKTFAWSKQREILNALIHYKRVAVRSCHASGKSRIAATALLWWLKRYPITDAFVISTAPTQDQVRTILWREINKLFGDSGLAAIGKCLQQEIQLRHKGGNHIVAYGKKTRDLDESAFQGIHAKNILVIIDEASGVPALIWEAIETLISGGNGRVLAIGNPTATGTEFHRCFKKNSGFYNIGISYADTPNFTDEVVPDLLRELLINKDWQEEMLRKWGGKNQRYISRVLGQFPDDSITGFFPSISIEQAQLNKFNVQGKKVLGCDIGAGGDPSMFYLRTGNVVRYLDQTFNPDTAETGLYISELVERHDCVAVVDHIGVGNEAYKVAKEKHPDKVFGCAFGGPAKSDKNYFNRRAELFGIVRHRLVNNKLDIDENDKELEEELDTVLDEKDPKGRIRIEPKREIIKRLGRSTNRLDSVAFTFGVPNTTGMPIVIDKAA